MKNRTVRAAMMRTIRRVPGEERSVGLGMVLDCGDILHREEIWRKHELRRLTQANGLLDAEICFSRGFKRIPEVGEACK
jgi:hypothetical protein